MRSYGLWFIQRDRVAGTCYESGGKGGRMAAWQIVVGGASISVAESSLRWLCAVEYVERVFDAVQ